MNLRRFTLGLVATSLLGVSSMAAADSVTLRVHHFLPPSSPAHANFIQPWCDKIAEESNGRLECEIYPAMQLGGSPPQLINQVRDGVVDIVWTLPGYTSGRFPFSEVFELPFVTRSQEKSSKAIWDYVQDHALEEEFRGVHPIAVWVNGPNQLHLRNQSVESLEDLRGKRIRAPSRMGNRMLEALGATPVGMPVPQMAESLSRGVIDGALVPWEVLPPTRTHELTRHHTETDGERTLITSTMIFVMNERTYSNLPSDLKEVIDNNSGRETSSWASSEFANANAAGREAAEGRGNQIISLSEAEIARWQEASSPVIQRWINDMNERGVDGQALYDHAVELVDHYEYP